MAGENEPARLLLPYLQRADELQKHEPLVAYYCRLYAMDRGLKIPQNERTKTTNALLVSLMKQLEKDKKSLNLGPDDHLHLEGFALNVFAKADKQDRAGRADLNTAKTFYAASIFFEILNQFGEPLPDLEQKQKYSAWKAADIRKALKEGRKPLPGPPDGDNDPPLQSNDLDSNGSYSTLRPDPSNIDFNSEFHSSSHQDDDPVLHQPTILSRQSSNISSPPPLGIPPHLPPQNAAYDFQPPPSNNGPEHSYPQTYHHQPYQSEPPPHHDIPYSYQNFQTYPSFNDTSLPSTPSHFPYHQPSDFTNYPSNGQHIALGRKESVLEDSPTPTQSYQYDSSYVAPPEKIAEAHKAARFAVGALAFDDVPTAIEHLKKSLELLTNPSAEH